MRKNIEILEKLRDNMRLIMLGIAALILILVRISILPQPMILVILAILIGLLYKNKINEIDLMLYSFIFPSELYAFIGIGISILLYIYKVIFKYKELRKLKKEIISDKYIILWVGVISILTIISVIRTKSILNN